MNKILQKLQGGDLRSVGKVDEVVEMVQKDTSLFSDLFSGLLTEDPLIRMRAADAIEKITIERPELLQSYKSDLINKIMPIQQQEVRWHIAQIIPRLELSKIEIKKVSESLLSWLENEKESRIVRVLSFQALVDLSKNNTELKENVQIKLKELQHSSIPSLRSRSKKLLENF